MTPLGHAGIGIAGDVFDFRIIDRAIAPLLGKGDTYRVMGKPLPVPPEYYSGFARWHLLSLMRNSSHACAPSPRWRAPHSTPNVCAT